MPKQVELDGFVTSTSPSPMPGSPSPKKIHSQPNFTAIIVKLEPASYGRCCICNYRGPLRYCLEYFNSEGAMILWGDICQNCADKFQRKGESGNK